MEISKENACQVIEQMDRHIRSELLEEGKIQKGQLWENTYIKQQIEKRKAGGAFSLEDHIRAVVYAMLSSTIKWNRVEKHIDPETKRIACVDEIFCDYNARQLLSCKPDDLANAVQKIGCAGPATWQQMEALISANVPKLMEIEQESESIDAYYQRWIDMDSTYKALITALSAPGGKDKMGQLDIALVCEYLRNAGYSLPKPDRHIRRILGSDYLAFSDKQEVPAFEAFDIVVKLAELAGKSAAETDYILWLYCAAGYGEICTARKPKCDICAAGRICESGYNKLNNTKEGDAV